MLKNKGRLWIFLLIGILLLLTAAGVTAYTVGGQERLQLNGTAVDNQPNVQDVTLRATNDETVRLEMWQGKFALVFFGYANCPDVCPLTMAQLARTYEELGEPQDLQVL